MQYSHPTHHLQANVDGYTRELYVHETMATDTDNIRKVFGNIKVYLVIFYILKYFSSGYNLQKHI